MTRKSLPAVTTPNSRSFFSTCKHTFMLLTLCCMNREYCFKRCIVWGVHRKYSLSNCSVKQTQFPEKMLSHQNFNSHFSLDLNPNSTTSRYLDSKPNLYSDTPAFCEPHKSHAEVCDSCPLAKSDYRQFWCLVPSTTLHCLGHIGDWCRRRLATFLLITYFTDLPAEGPYQQKQCKSHSSSDCP